MIKQDKLRTAKQSRALHLMFEQLAIELNEAGLYVGQVIRMDAPWNKDRVKELIWRPTQEKMLNKKSTTQLTSKEIDEVFTVIHKAIAGMGLDVQFPSIETLMLQSRLKE